MGIIYTKVAAEATVAEEEAVSVAAAIIPAAVGISPLEISTITNLVDHPVYRLCYC